MAQAGLGVVVEPPGPLPGWGGLMPTLRALGNVIDLSPSENPGRSERELASEEARILWRPTGCGAAGSWPPCPDDEEGPKEIAEQPANLDATGWTVYSSDQCDTAGYTFAERIERARVNLDRKIGNAIGAEMWRGTLAVEHGWPTPNFASDATLLAPIGEASPLTLGLGAIQDSLLECLGDEVAGMIAATRTTVTEWFSSGAIYWEINRGIMRDIYGNVIVTSGGFDGSDPEGNIATTRPWAYGMGPLVVRLGRENIVPTDIGQALDRVTNDVTVFVERNVSFQFDTCCVFGIGIDLCCHTCGDEGS